ncbi:MAG: copper-binding protein [Candidatus Krumholzibacteriia bacterium]
MTTTPPGRRWLWITWLTLAAILVGGCGGGGGDGQANAVRYTVRGVIEKLPAVDGPDHAIYIHHAAIPDYRNEAGEVVGMMSMVMPFPVADGVSLDGLAVGDPVEFTFTMQWQPHGHYEIVAIAELPTGTVIAF